MPIPDDLLSECLTRWGGPLTAWLRGRCSQPEDLVQETFCRLYTLPVLPDRPGAWLFRVAGNLLREEYRSNTRRRARELRYAPQESVSAPSVDPRLQEVQEAVERLEPELKEVVIARTWGDLTLSETAEVLGISTTTAHRRYQDALSQLKTLLN
ncbi:MAG: RNA polymerase sigma factor [Pirellulaceae bacterium]|jgi:RNA polymerase sigma-70 factor (ECF subfamily)